jgi:hypothetical protein
VEGALTPTQKLSGYYEMDFLGVGVTSNYNETNSWVARLRQGFFAYDNTEWGFHFLGGQAWSMLTQNTVGITARKENVPMTIEANYVPGFDYTRNWQLRVVKDIGTWAALGLSVENPAELVYASTGAVGNGGNIGGFAVNFTNCGNSFLGTGPTGTGGLPGAANGSTGYCNGFNTDVAPDVIAKAAFDPGWGHYEVFGIARFFNDNRFNCAIAPATIPAAGGQPAQVAGTCSTLTVGGVPANSFAGQQHDRVKMGDGVGGSVLLPIWAKFIDVQASAMYGRGIGRYGASQLSDVVVGPDGTLEPITAAHFLAGVILHPWAGLDIYGYAGTERADANWSMISTGVVNGIRQTGFGIPNAINTGCYITTLNSFTGGTSNCAAINRQVTGVTAGFWQDLYKGNFGRVAAGFEWEWIRRESFPGTGVPTGTAGPAGLTPAGSVKTDDNIFLTSLRWYPF